MDDSFDFDPNYRGNPLEQLEGLDEYQLYLAVNCGNRSLASDYLSHNTKGDILFPSLQDTALHRAALWGASELIVEMVKNGADVDTPDLFSNTPLHIAAKRGHLECCLALIALDADLLSENEYGVTPIAEAVVHGHTDIVELFIRYQGYSSLNQKHLIGAACAVTRSENCHSEEIVELLIASDFKVGEKDSSGNTPLFIVSKAHSIPIAQSLVSAGADVRAINNDFESVLFPAVRSHLSTAEELESYIGFLYDAGAPLNQCNRKGNSALHEAVMNDNVKAVKALLELGIDTSIRNANAKTALELSEIKNKAVGVTRETRLLLKEIKELLQKHG